MKPELEYEPHEIDRMIDEALAEIERGESVDGDEAFRLIRERRKLRK